MRLFYEFWTSDAKFTYPILCLTVSDQWLTEHSAYECNELVNEFIPEPERERYSSTYLDGTIFRMIWDFPSFLRLS